MRLTAKKDTAFEQTLKELYDQHIRNKEDAIEILTIYYGVKPAKLRMIWGFGYTCMFSPLDMTPEHMPETIRKGVKATDGLLTVDRRTKRGRGFLDEWEKCACAKGLSGESLEQFGIYTLDQDTHKYGYWCVGTDEDDLYYLEVSEYAARRLTDDARKMVTIDIQQY